MENKIDEVVELADAWNDRQQMLDDIKKAVGKFQVGPDGYYWPFESAWEYDEARDQCRLVAAAVRIVNARAGMLLVDPEPFLKIDEKETRECEDAIHTLAANIVIEAESEAEANGTEESDAHSNTHRPPETRAPIPENGDAKKKIRKWDEQCETILRRWVRAMKEGGKWIPLATYLNNVLPSLQRESPGAWQGLAARRFTQKFADNKGKWEWQVLQWKKPK